MSTGSYNKMFISHGGLHRNIGLNFTPQRIITSLMTLRGMDTPSGAETMSNSFVFLPYEIGSPFKGQNLLPYSFL